MTRLALALIVLLLAGCVSPGAQVEPSSVEALQERPVVIALLDSGVNPYLDVFRTGAGDDFVPAGARVAELATEGDFEARVRSDKSLWESADVGVLTHFSGTRLSAISFSEEPTLLDEYGHGAFTTYLAAREAPRAAIVLIKVDAYMCRPSDCLLSPTVADGMEWIAQQDWIDVVSISIAIPGNLPDRPELHDEMARYIAASRAAAAAGKIIVNGAGNTITPPLPDYFNGPPWVIAVGGVDPEKRGETLMASKVVDVVSDYNVLLPDHESVGEPKRHEWQAGTSLATPIVAGTLAEAMALGRAAGARPTTADLRAALNASAMYFAASEWDASPRDDDGLPWDIFRYSLPVLVQPQMGWGYVNGSLAPEIARRVLEQDFAIPPEKGQAMVFQPQWQKAREEYWARYGA